MISVMTTTETRSSWSDWRLDELREKVDRDFARQDEHVRELRREVNEFIRQRPSVLARWGSASHKAFPAESPRRSTPPSGLSWSDGRIDDLQSEIENVSAQLECDIAEIKEEMEVQRREISDRRIKRSDLIFYFFLAVMVTIVWLPGIVEAIQSK
jgi:hypothetical protein